MTVRTWFWLVFVCCLVDAPRRHLGVFLLTHEVELGRPDVGMPGKLEHLVHLGLLLGTGEIVRLGSVNQ
jgi:hypothetical protein